MIGQRYVTEGDVTKIDKTYNFMHYNNAHVVPEHSGSPVYVEESFSYKGLSYKQKTMIAIHFHGVCYPNQNGILIASTFGTRITQKHALFYLSNPYITG